MVWCLLPSVRRDPHRHRPVAGITTGHLVARPLTVLSWQTPFSVSHLLYLFGSLCLYSPIRFVPTSFLHHPHLDQDFLTKMSLRFHGLIKIFEFQDLGYI